MRVYVAGKWEDRERVRKIQQWLLAAGHEITCDWTCHDFGPDGVKGNEEDFQAIALEDIEAVKRADAVVAVMERPYAYKGLYVEIGACLAQGTPVYVLGDAGDSCIFMHHPLVHKTTAFALAGLALLILAKGPQT